MMRLCPLLLAVALICSYGSAQPLYRQLGDGVEYQRFEGVVSGKPQVIQIITADVNNPSVRISAALAKDFVMQDDVTKGRETISSLTMRKNAVAGVNGDYFPFTGDPLNLCVIGGDYVSEPGNNRAVIAATDTHHLLIGQPGWGGSVTMPDARVQKLGGINRPAGPNECVLYTPAYGPTMSGKSAMKVLRFTNTPQILRPDSYTLTVESVSNMEPYNIGGSEWLLAFTGSCASLLDDAILGKQITIQFSMKPADSVRVSPASPGNAVDSDIWNKLLWAVGGGPWLVRDGSVYIDAAQENFKDDITEKRHPRTAVGIDALGRLMMVTVDGRRDGATGMTMAELASYMKSLGAVNAMNLDGGGSTTMALYGGRLANQPSDTSPRAVANGLLLYTKPSTLQPLADFSVWPGSVDLSVGQQVEFNLMGFDVPEVVAGDVIWTLSSRLGRITPNGVFTADHPGTAYVNAYFDNRSYRALVTVNP